MFFHFIISLLIMPAPSFANFTAEIFEKGSDPKNPLFTSESKTSQQGELSEITTLYKTPKGDVVLKEESKIKGPQLISYHIEQKQTGQSGQIEVKENKVFFKRVDKEGKEKTNEEKWVENLTTSANFVPYLQSHWKELVEGKEIPIRHAVWDRLETVGFNLKKVGEEKLGEVKAIKIRMKVSSTLLSLLVAPLTFSFTEDGTKLLAMDGRVAPKREIGGQFKDLDGSVIYHHTP